MKLHSQSIPRQLLGLFLLAATSSIYAEPSVLLTETFPYPNGSLRAVADGAWSNHSGTLGQADVLDGALQLAQSESEDIHRLIPGAPFYPTNSPSLFLGFKLQASGLPAGDGGFFAHFKDATTGFRGRVFIQRAASGLGRYQLGVSAGAVKPTAMFQRDLDLNHAYQVVVKLVLADSQTILWIDPKSESDEHAVAADTASSIGVAAVAFRQSLSSGHGMGMLAIDDLFVAREFSGIVPKDASVGSGTGGQGTHSPSSILAVRQQLDLVNLFPTNSTQIHTLEAIVIGAPQQVGDDGPFVFLQDATAGIACRWPNGADQNVAIGDRWRLSGVLRHHAGLLYLDSSLLDPSQSPQRIASGLELPRLTPLKLENVNQSAFLDRLEGSRVIVSNVWLTLIETENEGRWQAWITNSGGQALELDLASLPDPATHAELGSSKLASISGILLQYDPAAPHNAGYTLRPAHVGEIQPSRTIPSNLRIEQMAGGGVRVIWLAASGKTYSVHKSDSPRGPFIQISAGLGFIGSEGQYLDLAVGSAGFYRIGLLSDQ